MLLISADPPEASHRFRQDLRVSMPLIADEEHVTADHYEIPICYQSPREQVYADGYIQPAAVVFVGDHQVYSFVQCPGVVNAGGALRRPGARKLLRILRRNVRKL